MSIVKNNIVTEGLSGMLGDVVVFRQLRGKTIMANRPRKPTRQSELQRENRQRFRAATLFAREAMKDPEKKERYRVKARKLNLPNAYTAAITDYLRKPTVNSVKCKGRSGDYISVNASKKGFTLASVEVIMTDAQGSPLITQAATLKDRGSNQWVARLPVALNAAAHRYKDCQVIVVATDHTGNMVRSVAPYRVAA
jgi:hypothetical protein